MALLEGLAGAADYTKDGAVTISELQTFVADRVSKLTEGRQNPRIPLQIGANPNARLARVG